MTSVSGLTVAPVKGLAAVPRQRVRLEQQGVAEDRRLFLLRADGTVATIRQLPALATLEPDLDLEAGELRLRLPGGGSVATAVHEAGAALSADLFGKQRAGRRLSGAVEDAVSEAAGEPLRLVLADRTGIGWDEGPVSLVSRASAAAVGLPEDEAGPQLRRLRVLVELEGAAPYEEDGWVGRDVRVGAAVVRVSHLLQRCVVIGASPVTGEQDWDGVRRLVQVRGRDLTCLGVIATVVEPGEVGVGDPVEPQMT
ncbi:hypothetical protein CLV35_2722 [Motilibacter peucedani]|uniref:MOSC domain-containing protein n=1 Tax=Motilibacter peucedani TaxID=598650 RepID=A0A420XM65_9ACTN|nr:MOSC N-terminal beta barrel domain-containing protein [Motilibacter peucedani]RKS72478.1 hypothetical protein CLV35_2722 [Motilibacter peucedani]